MSERDKAMEGYYAHPTSVIDDGAQVGDGTKVWHFCHIQPGARIGRCCTLGQNVNVSNNVRIGDGVKIQNNVSVYEGVELGDYVFCGPSMVFTNDVTPRARHPKGSGSYRKTLVGHDASIGANATIVCGHSIGACAMVAAGAVVTGDVAPYSLVAGVPARHVGWVCQCGERLGEGLACSCGKKYCRTFGGVFPPCDGVRRPPGKVAA